MLGAASASCFSPTRSCPQPAFTGPQTSAHTTVVACSEVAREARGRSVWAAAINQTSVPASRPLLTNVSLLSDALLRNTICCSFKLTSLELKIQQGPWDSWGHAIQRVIFNCCLF